MFPPRQATLCRIADAGKLIDHGIVIFFPAPASFTGEDVVEFHVHGGRAIVHALSNVLAAKGCRGAEPGEFTKRAFLNGKIDLTEAEAIADLIDAETEQQLAQAMVQVEGGLARLYQNWSDRLLNMLAHLEASLDFADEDLPDMMPALVEQAAALSHEISMHLNDARRGERLRTGTRIAILGAPNAGKSTLLNELAGRDIAIVSDRAGTTRDVLEVHLDLGGYPVILADTAGLREAADEIEAEGIARARRWSEAADIRLVLLDPTAPPCPDVEHLIDSNSIVVATKADLAAPNNVGCIQALSISVRTGTGMQQLLAQLTARVAELAGTVSSTPPTRERHRFLLNQAIEALARFTTLQEVDLAAEELRETVRCLGRITGRMDADALLDVIFRDFCIGK